MDSFARTTFLAVAIALAPGGCNRGNELTPEEQAQKLANDLIEAETRLRNGKIKDAEKIYLRILEQDQEQPDGLAGMALVRMAEKDYGSAEVLLKRALAKKSNDSRLHFQLGETYRLTERYAESVEPYKASWELDSEKADYGLAYGIALKKSNQFPQAEEVLRKVADLDPNVMFVWSELGDALREQNKLDEALKTYMKAQNTYRSDKMAHAGAAMVYEAKGNNLEAVNQWSEYIRMDCCSEYSNAVAKKKVMELKIEVPVEEGSAPTGTAEAAPAQPQGTDQAG